jgi:hypothetical protein
MDLTVGLPPTLQRFLFICGILAALIYLGTDLFAGLQKTGYRFDSESPSILSASGATTRPYVLPMNLVAGMLLVAFSIGLWLLAEQNWILRVVAGFLAGNAILSMVAVVFFPMNIGELMNTPANKVHVIIMATGEFLFILAIIFGIFAYDNWLRYLSIGIIVVFILLTILGLYVFPQIAHDPSRATNGIQERTMMYSQLLWLALQSIVLLRI